MVIPSRQPADGFFGDDDFLADLLVEARSASKDVEERCAERLPKPAGLLPALTFYASSMDV